MTKQNQSVTFVAIAALKKGIWKKHIASVHEEDKFEVTAIQPRAFWKIILHMLMQKRAVQMWKLLVSLSYNSGLESTCWLS